MVRTVVARRRVWSGVGNFVDVVNPQGQGADGRGALRGIRLQNLADFGWYQSGFINLRLSIDNGILLASGQLRVPMIDGQRPGRGWYVNLGQWVLGADYHENPLFAGSGACCECAMLVNEQRIPFHTQMRLQASWTWSGTSRLSGFTVDAWYEIKG